MPDDHAAHTHRPISRAEWLHIHNRSARDYITSEFVREVLIGMRWRRRAFFNRATGSVLDVACGTGNNFAHLPNATHITGVDFSPVMLEAARARAAKLGLQVTLVQSDAESLNFPDASFDTVISSLTTCSLFDPVAALRQMRRVCKPDGRILLLEHGRSSWRWLGRYQDRTVGRMIDDGGCRWNQEPQQLVQEAGLTITYAARSLLGMLHAIEVSPSPPG